MKIRIRAAAVLGLPAVVVCCPLPNPTVAAGAVAPLPESNYSVRSVCPAPAPGHASCLALDLRPTTPAARARTRPLGMTRRSPVTAPTAAEGVDGLTPDDLGSVYFPGEPAEASAPQTIALIDAYNDYAAEEDLQTYDEEFGLPALARCKTQQEDACFEQVDQAGNAEAAKLPFPHSKTELTHRENTCLTELAQAQKQNTNLSEAGEQACFEAEEAGGWAVEISTDIEMAHGICRNCRVLLVEAGKPSNGSLQEAEETTSYRNLGEGDESAVKKLHATEVSNSWGGSEPDAEEERELEEAGIDPFDYPDTVITASAGDAGYLNWTDAAEAKEVEEHGEETGYFPGANYPASSPYVLAVGGTKLQVNSSGARESESVWNEDPDPESGDDGAGGGGCSQRFSAPPWQQEVPDWTEVGCGSNRAVADVAADADPYTGVAVYDSVPSLRVEENARGESEIVDTPLEWSPIGGTSVASPIIASMFALAGGANGVAYPAETLYSHLNTTSLHDVTSGGNGSCDDDYLACSGSLQPTSALYPLDCGEGELICNAAPGCEGKYYDGPTGVGTPDGIGAFRPEAQPAIVAPKCAAIDKSSGDEGKEPSGGNQPGDGGGTTQPAGGASPSPEGKVTNGEATGSAAPRPSALIPVLSAPALTKTATAALSHGRPKATQVAFAFTLNVAARVKVTLSILLVSHGRKRWRMLPYSLTITAAKGHDSARLSAHGTLAPGRYRLVLAPQHGAARTLLFQVG